VAGGNVPECDLIVKGTVGGEPRGWVRESGNNYRDDEGNVINDAALRALADSEGPLTYTCMPPGSGTRAGINRDGDIVLDGLDNCPAVANDDQIDSNTDGVGDACEAGTPGDLDEDGVLNADDNCPNDSNPLQEDFDLDDLGDACDPDDDNDGLLDTVETDTGDFVDANDTGTSPKNVDSDGDGFDDLRELLAGSDPTEASSVPASVPSLGFYGQIVLIVGLLTLAGAALWRRSGASALRVSTR
jgi:hypothetical protein